MSRRSGFRFADKDMRKRVAPLAGIEPASALPNRQPRAPCSPEGNDFRSPAFALRASARQARPWRRTQPCARLIRRFRNENLASEHLLDGIEGIHELTQFDNAAFVEPDEIGDEKLNGATGRALA